jgi:hypothetical protein
MDPLKLEQDFVKVRTEVHIARYIVASDAVIDTVF